MTRPAREDPFADLAPVYDAVFPAVVPKYREAVELMVSLLPFGRDQRACIVELGCGTGEVLSLLARTFPGAELVGVDSSEAMLEVARRKLGPFEPRVRLVQHDLEQEAWPEEVSGCHAVLTAYLMDYLSVQTQEQVVRAAAENLVSDGRFLSLEFVRPEEPRISQVFRELEYRFIAEAMRKGEVDEGQLKVLTGLSEEGVTRHVVSLKERLEMLRRARFSAIDTAWRFLNFVLITARKP